ncbi:MAG: HD domain-containing protein [Anaerolineales bacterium]|nr:HD domain-containing protein [Anaerolineales bacterium]
MSAKPSSYAGRWVAKVRDKIVAQGRTAEEALQACQQSRYKEKPEVSYMPYPLHPLIEIIQRDYLPVDQELYLVGGAVRDLLLQRRSPDLDFALPANGIAFARKMANQLHADFMPLDVERDTGRVIFTQPDGAQLFLDFATYRGGDSLEADLRARDFTINALAYDLRTNEILDPLDGRKDLAAKLIRACSATSIEEDPVRILRAIRLAAAFDFHLDPETRAHCHSLSGALTRISPERQRDEIFKILHGPKPEAAFKALEMLDTFPYILPELTKLKGVTQSSPHVYDVWKHTLAVLSALEEILDALSLEPSLPANPLSEALSATLGKYKEQFAEHFSNSLNPNRSQRALLFFAALYHDISKPDTKTIEADGRIRFFDHDQQGAEVIAERGRAFNLSNDENAHLVLIVKQHMRIHQFYGAFARDGQMPSRRAIYRFFRDARTSGVELTLLALADVRGTYGATLTPETWQAYLQIANQLLESYWERPQEIIAPPRLLDGRELMRELNLTAGPLIGELLEMIRENQAIGKIQNKEQALALAREEYLKATNGES